MADGSFPISAPSSSGTSFSDVLFVRYSRAVYPKSGRYYPAGLFLGVDTRLSEYTAYSQPDWDGFGADPISSETLMLARRFLNVVPRWWPMPDIAPGADGTIGFEWRYGRSGHMIFVDIGPDGSIGGFVAGSEPHRFARAPYKDGFEALLYGISAALNERP